MCEVDAEANLKTEVKMPFLLTCALLFRPRRWRLHMPATHLLQPTKVHGARTHNTSTGILKAVYLRNDFQSF